MSGHLKLWIFKPFLDPFRIKALIKPVSDIIIFYLKILTDIDNLFNLVTRTETECNPENEIFPNNGHQAHFISEFESLKYFHDIFVPTLLRIIENRTAQKM